MRRRTGVKPPIMIINTTRQALCRFKINRIRQASVPVSGRKQVQLKAALGMYACGKYFTTPAQGLFCRQQIMVIVNVNGGQMMTFHFDIGLHQKSYLVYSDSTVFREYSS
jgi:hypothetical protein